MTNHILNVTYCHKMQCVYAMFIRQQWRSITACYTSIHIGNSVKMYRMTPRIKQLQLQKFRVCGGVLCDIKLISISAFNQFCTLF